MELSIIYVTIKGLSCIANGSVQYWAPPCARQMSGILGTTSELKDEWRHFWDLN